MLLVKTCECTQEIHLVHFTDGTLKMRCRLPGESALHPVTIVWRYEKEEELVALIHLTHHLREKGVDIIHLEMPYIPNARQDRVQSDSEVFTLKSFAKTINWLGFKSVRVTDAHSRVSVALLDRVINDEPDDAIEMAIDMAKERFNTNALTVFYPDEGAMKRYHTSHAYPKAFGMKTRNPSTGNVDSLQIAGDSNEIAGKYVLIVDDICSKGDTALRSATELRKAGAKGVALYITHCENTILDSVLLQSDIIEHIYTTRSIFTGMNTKITVLGLD